MKLTKQCKKAFKNWFELLDDFYYLEIIPANMRYGVYVDFFDSVGIVIDTHPILDYDMKNYTKVLQFQVYVRKLNAPDKSQESLECETRQEARFEAIKKADQIYNNEKKN